MNKEVSNLFVDIFLNFNVISQVEKIKKLTRQERLILLVLCADVFSEDNRVVIQNFDSFKEDLVLIHDSLEQEVKDDDELKNAIETELSNIVNNGVKIPNPLTEEEATIKRREIEISNIIDEFGDI